MNIEQTYQVKDIVKRVFHPRNPDLAKKATERIGHWTRAGLLRTIGETSKGTGRQRSYSETEIFVAAVLQELNKYGSNRAMLEFTAREVRDALDWPMKDLASLHESTAENFTRICEARDGSENLVFLCIIPDPISFDGFFGMEVTYTPFSSDLSWSGIAINLSRILDDAKQK